MLSSTLFLAASALVGLVSAQNYTTSGPLNITASQFPLSERQEWCDSQIIACRQICGGQAFPNTCNANDLSYVCKCTDGSHPNISAYQQTLPFYICEFWKSNCVLSHPMDLVGQQGCLSVTCGQKNATAVGTSASSSASSASASSTAKSTGGSGGSGSSSTSSTSSSFAAATQFASSYGTQILAGGMLMAFGMAL